MKRKLSEKWCVVVNKTALNGREIVCTRSMFAVKPECVSEDLDVMKENVKRNFYKYNEQNEGDEFHIFDDIAPAVAFADNPYNWKGRKNKE